MIWSVSAEQQRAAMSDMWNIFPVGPGDPIHLRAIWGKGVPGEPRATRNLTFTARAYPCVRARQNAFESNAIKLNQQRYNVYTCFNPISPSFAGDEQNGLAVTDSDILCRRYLLIDFDRANATGPATDAEIDEVFRVAHQLEVELFYERGDDPITVSSGNGAHIYIPLQQLPNDASTKLRCSAILKEFAARYNTATVKVDTCVFNASRITKVPGTIAYKGLETEERHYRMADVVA